MVNLIMKHLGHIRWYEVSIFINLCIKSIHPSSETTLLTLCWAGLHASRKIIRQKESYTLKGKGMPDAFTPWEIIISLYLCIYNIHKLFVGK